MSKKPFKETTVGKLLFGAATVINPTLGSVLNGVTSPKEALAEITKAKIYTGGGFQCTFEKVMMAVVLAYFGGRTTEKATSIFKK